MGVYTLKRLKKKTYIILCAVLILAVLFAASAVRAYGSGKIPGGTRAGGVDVSGLTLEEATDKLRQNLDNSIFDKAVHVVLGDVEKTVVPSDFLAAYDYEKTAEKASHHLKEGNFFLRIGRAFCSFFVKQEVGVEIEYDKVAYEDILESLLADIGDRVVEHSWEIQDDKLVVTTGRPGLMPDAESVSGAILDTIRMGTYNEKITFEKKSRRPAPLTAEKLQDKICAESSNAYYEIVEGKVVMYPHVLGVSFDKAEAQAIIDSHTGDGATFEIPLVIHEPEITLEEIEAQMFSDVIGEYATRFNSGDVARSKNIALASNKINGTILAPGEVFSYNGVVGERSYSEGFETASVYVNGETVPGIGGGICQVSSTLFNAVVFANLDIVERVNHQLTVSYVPLGRDATVDYGNIDFRFRNSTEFPIKIVCSSEGGKMYTAIYGQETEDRETVSFETVTIGHTDPPERKVDDPTLPLGEEKVESEGSSGYVVDTYKIIEREGREPEKVYLCRSNYNGSFRVIHVGTGEAVPSPTPDEGEEPTASVSPVTPTPSGTSSHAPSPSPTRAPSPSPTATPEAEEAETPAPTPDSDSVSDSGL
ncbi:MAG: hypothetical protein E7390_07025 [Ruminococcaceae bacterium]|nr:hypothetical protein [Oscillospiraceae bacterium]